MIDISIIVPIYNAEKHLNKCLDSLVNQTKKELEFILINDGSTDSSEKIIKSYDDKRIKYYKNKNQGIGKTRNFGINKAVGKYIMFLDSDDFLELNACERMYEKVETDKLDIVICDYYRCFENGKIEEVKLPNFKNSSLKDNPNIICEHLSPWAKIYKTDLLKKNNIKFAENLKYEDAPFVIEALDCAEKIGKVNIPLNFYVIHEKSETTVRDEKIFDIITIVDQIRKYTKNKAYLKDKIDKLTVRILTNYTIQQRMQKDKKIGMKFINEAFAYLKKEVPDYKNNKYYENRNYLKRTIEKNIVLTKLYCRIYNNKKKRKI